jgi:hypothetical protein
MQACLTIYCHCYSSHTCRRTKQALHDKRFALYERAITFDGPDVHSVSVPLRGTVLAGRVESICDEIVKHITDVTAGQADKTVGRMALNFKVDGNGKIWILWSDSVRIESKSSSGMKVDDTRSISEPLNMNTVVKLPSAIKLSQIPSHDTKIKLENHLSSATCPSCGKHDTNENFQKVPYKTVICHFEKTLDMLKANPDSHPSNLWPPEERFIKAAGGIGFGTVSQQDKSNEALVIAPVIRHVHPKLQVKGYQMYRGDPLFLQKTCDVCEDCYLAYSELKQSSFLMVPPVDLPKEEFHYHPEMTRNRVNKAKSKIESVPTSTSIDKIFDFNFKAPEIPPAILEPLDSPGVSIHRLPGLWFDNEFSTLIHYY